MPNRALICGINNYKEISDLRGCVNDALTMKAILIDRFGFEEGDIELMLDEEVTKHRFKDKWKWLVNHAAPGDHLVFFIAGHGSQIRADVDETDDEPDLKDEILCLYDMDRHFRNKSGYLRDDELRKMIAKVPAGAELSVITDTCHSASMTRVFLQRKPTGDEIRALRDEHTARDRDLTPDDRGTHDVLVRYFPPPPKLRPVEGARSLRETRTMATSDAAAARYLHFSACRDDQTAADAHIDGAFCGAFTHFFSRALRQHPDADSGALRDAVAGMLMDAGFPQVPQTDGAPRQAPIFGQRRSGSAGAPQPISSSTDGGADGGAGDVLVCVHGIGPHLPGFSGSWFEALEPHLGGLFGSGGLGKTRFEAYWADLVNDLSGRAVGDPVTMDSLRAELLEELMEHERREADAATDEHPEDRAMPGEGSLATRDAGFYTGRGLPQIDDFVRYMLFPQVRRNILDRFHHAMDQALAEGRRIHLLSHSWGTVVAQEGLLERAERGTTGNVVNHFTVGAALDFRTVRVKLGLRNEKPRQVDRWFNLNTRGDIVGGPLTGNFPITRDYVGLPAPACGWLDLGCRHGAYFGAQNLHIVRDILARHMTEASDARAGGATPLAGSVTSDAALDKAIQDGAAFAIRSRSSLAGSRSGDRLLLAEGDSWFDFPFTDLLDALEDRHGYDVRSVAHRGDTIEGMAYHGQLDAFGRLAAKLGRRGTRPVAVLVSGGGNDIVGRELSMLLNHRLSPQPGLAMGALRDVIHNRLRLAHATVLSGVMVHCDHSFGTSNPKVPIVVHGYDYAVPDGRGVWGIGVLPGPWIEPSLRAKGFDDLDEGRAIVGTMIDEVNRMLEELTDERRFQGRVCYANLRGTLESGDRYKSDWQDELHPTRDGFRKVAAKIDETIRWCERSGW